MQRFKSIAVVINLNSGNLAALDCAKSIVQANDASCHILCVTSKELPAQARTAMELYLESHCHFDYQCHFLVGIPIVEIVRFVNNNGIDMVIKEPEGNSKIHNFFYGSLTLSLLRKLPCALWIVKKSPQETYQKIAIAVDPLAEERAKKELNDALIEIGTSFAKRSGNSECHLVTAWRLEGEGFIDSPIFSSQPNDMEEALTEQKVKHAKAFEALQKQHRTILDQTQTHMLHGDAAQSIAEFIHQEHVDIIVMGTLARSGVKGFVIGNTAEAIINQIDCSIIAIKPSTFVSPIV